MRLRMPLPLEGKYLRNLQVTPISQSIPGADIKVQAGRLEARMTVSTESKVVLGARLSFTARAQAPAPGDSEEEPDRELYLRRQEGLIVISDRVQILAESLVTASAAPLDKLRAFWDYIYQELKCGMLHYDQIDAASPCDWVLDSGWFDCQTGSALFVSLCRAQGIPARLVAGRVLYRLAPTQHYWAEAWVQGQGWTPFDFLSWDLSQGGAGSGMAGLFFWTNRPTHDHRAPPQGVHRRHWRVDSGEMESAFASRGGRHRNPFFGRKRDTGLYRSHPRGRMIKAGKPGRCSP